jgi:uncharacterized protein YyaL (SSP411 family)
MIMGCGPTEKKTANDLINETSPYLLQHAYNPVNWKAWNDQTLELAKKENKLMVISIGYSACHWCHVMEEESFENDSIAKLMNDNFISIKVDREERPDIDNIYINAVQLMTGNSGWPLNCITLPDGRPIFGGTYFPKDQWKTVLLEISKLYKEEPQKAISYAERVTKGIQNASLIQLNKEEASFKKEVLTTSIEASKKVLDMDKGGFVGAPKFPMPIALDYLLRYDYQFEDSEIKTYIHTSLTKMAFGGIYDQVGGGFSRYSVDNKWHVPHFEKMLYDNGQLVSLYSKAYLRDKNVLYKNVVQETLRFIDRELSTKEGAFYSSLDADSRTKEGELEEGAYYVWTEDELKALLKEEYSLFSDYYNINDYGFWENNHYVLIRNQSDEAFAKEHSLALSDLQSQVKSWKSVLAEARNKRQKPNLDDKVLTSWNALMLQGYVDAYRAFGDKNYLDRAIQNADFLLENQLRKDGGLNRNFKDGKSTINAYLEDYATVVQSLISLHEVTLDEKYLKHSQDLMSYAMKHFYDDQSGMFFYTSDEDKNLIARKVEVIDGVIPSSNSIIANNLFKLGHYLYKPNMTKMAEQMLNNLSADIETNALGFGNWLHLMTNITNPFYEVAVVGENAVSINEELGAYYLPNTIITGATEDSNQPLLANKYVEGETLIYVCVNGTCKLPQTDLKRALKTIAK